MAGRGLGRGISLELGAVKDVDARTSSSLSVRAFYRGGCGWSSANRLTAEDAAAVGEAAGALARAADPDPDFVDLPDGGTEIEIEGLCDDAVAGLTLADLLGYLTPEIETIKSIIPDAVIGGGSGAGWGESVYVSSKGHVVRTRGTSVSCSIGAVVRRDDDVGSYWDYDSARRMCEFAPAGIGKVAAEESLRLLGARTGPTGEFPIVFGDRACSGCLDLVSAANAEDIQRNRSYMAGKEGVAVAGPALTIVDDPFIAGGLRSSATDGEGVPHRRMTLVDRGVLTTYIHNSYTAGKAKVANTAFSARGGIATTNTNPVPGEQLAAELIREVDDGIYVDTGHIAVNRASGDFSQVIDFGYRIEKGEVTYPIKETMIAGSYLDFLANIDAVSSDYRDEPGYIMPSMRVTRVRVIAR
jgi:PmbA protein